MQITREADTFFIPITLTIQSEEELAAIIEGLHRVAFPVNSRSQIVTLAHKMWKQLEGLPE
jgi:hypothetical protein